jgi:hypothetical protein
MKVRVEYVTSAEVEISDDYKFMTENAMSEEAYRKWLNTSRELDEKFEKMFPNLIEVEKVVEVETEKILYEC